MISIKKFLVPKTFMGAQIYVVSPKIAETRTRDRFRKKNAGKKTFKAVDLLPVTPRTIALLRKIDQYPDASGCPSGIYSARMVVAHLYFVSDEPLPDDVLAELSVLARPHVYSSGQRVLRTYKYGFIVSPYTDVPRMVSITRRYAIPVLTYAYYVTGPLAVAMDLFPTPVTSRDASALLYVIRTAVVRVKETPARVLYKNKLRIIGPVNREEAEKIAAYVATGGAICREA